MWQGSMRTLISKCKRRLRGEAFLPIGDNALPTLEFHPPNGLGIVALKKFYLSSNVRTRPSRNVQLPELNNPFFRAWHPI